MTRGRATVFLSSASVAVVLAATALGACSNTPLELSDDCRFETGQTLTTVISGVTQAAPGDPLVAAGTSQVSAAAPGQPFVLELDSTQVIMSGSAGVDTLRTSGSPWSLSFGGTTPGNAYSFRSLAYASVVGESFRCAAEVAGSAPVTFTAQ